MLPTYITSHAYHGISDEVMSSSHMASHAYLAAENTDTSIYASPGSVRARVRTAPSLMPSHAYYAAGFSDSSTGANNGSVRRTRTTPSHMPSHAYHAAERADSSTHANNNTARTRAHTTRSRMSSHAYHAAAQADQSTHTINGTAQTRTSTTSSHMSSHTYHARRTSDSSTYADIGSDMGRPPSIPESPLSEVSSTRSSTETLVTPIQTSLFPREFGFYRRPNSHDLVIATSSKHYHLFYIHTSSDTDKPALTLCDGPDPLCDPTIASVQFSSQSSRPGITVDSISSDSSTTTRLQRGPCLPTKLYFTLFMPNLQGAERFDWKLAGRHKAGDLGRVGALNLVRFRTGQIVATYSKVCWALTKRGKMEFLVEDYGRSWEALAVMSLLGVLEMEKRSLSKGEPLFG